MGFLTWYPLPKICTYTSCDLLYSCKGCRMNMCLCYRHAILPRGAVGRNFNSCFHVRRIGIYNPTVSEEVFTTQGLKVRFTEKGIERLRKLYTGKALKLVFADRMQWCDCALKCLCCPCKFCTWECCPEMTAYDLIVPGEAFIEGTDVDARLGVRGTTCCLTFPLVYCCAALCSWCCENKVNVHHTEYELADHQGDFIAPNNINMDRSLVKGPASPRSRGKERVGANETVLKLHINIQQ